MIVQRHSLQSVDGHNNCCVTTVTQAAATDRLLNLGSNKQEHCVFFSTVDFSFPPITRTRSQRQQFYLFPVHLLEFLLLRSQHFVLFTQSAELALKEKQRMKAGKVDHVLHQSSRGWTYINVNLVRHVRVGLFPVVVWSHLSEREHSAQTENRDTSTHITSQGGDLMQRRGEARLRELVFRPHKTAPLPHFPLSVQRFD